jgi:hypothetical protein
VIEQYTFDVDVPKAKKVKNAVVPANTVAVLAGEP